MAWAFLAYRFPAFRLVIKTRLQSGLFEKPFVYLEKFKKKYMKYIKLSILLLIIFNFSSCTITEKLVLNDNGSGKFTYDIDGSKMMTMLGSTLKTLDEDDSKKSKKKKKKEKLLEENSTSKKAIDSVWE